MRSLVAVLLVAAALVSAPGAARAAGDPVAERGRVLFDRVGCYECHGHAGQGGAAGPHIAAITWPYAAFAAYVRRPAREMPPFTAKVLSDADLAAIYAYVRALPAPSASSANR